jgi:hypothetical protein
MFLPFVAAVLVVIGLFELGALSVWVAVLKSLLAVAVVVALLLTIALIWRRTKTPTSRLLPPSINNLS